MIGEKRAAAAAGHEIAFFADTKLDRAQKLAAKYGAAATADWREVTAADVDIVVVATSHEMLSPISVSAVTQGKHVLVEKPAGLTVAEIAEIVSAAEKNKRYVKVGFNHRFHPGLLKAREIFDSGALGPLMFIRGRYGHGGRPGMEKEWRCKPELSGGGELIDQGSHLVDLSRWFLGDLKLDYAATPALFWNIPVDDNCFLALSTPTKQMAWLHASWSEWKNMFSFEIYGRDGKISIDGLGGSYGTEKITFYKMLPGMGPPETTSWEFPFPDRSWNLEFANFTAAIAQGVRPCGDIYDALALHQIIDQAYGFRP